MLREHQKTLRLWYWLLLHCRFVKQFQCLNRILCKDLSMLSYLYCQQLQRLLTLMVPAKFVAATETQIIGTTVIAKLTLPVVVVIAGTLWPFLTLQSLLYGRCSWCNCWHPVACHGAATRPMVFELFFLNAS
jgi:hypothetical protein